MNYKEYLSSEPFEGQDFPYNIIEFFNNETMIDAFYVDHSKLRKDSEDDISEIVDSYLDDNPEVTRAVAYRVESPKSRFAYREFGRD